MSVWTFSNMSVFSSGVDHFSIVWVYLTLVLVPLVLYHTSGWLKIARLMLRIPGPPALPILGNALLITNTEKMEKIGDNCHAMYGPVMRIWVTVIPFFMLNDPQHVQTVLSSPKNTDKIGFYKLLHNFLGQGLITSSGNTWRQHRKLIQPCFNMKIMETFITTFAGSSNIFLNKLKDVSHEKNVNILSLVNESVFDILNESVLGIKMNRDRSKDERVSPYRQGKVVAQDRITKPWLLLNFIYDKTEQARKEVSQKDQLVDYTKNIVRQKMEKRSMLAKEPTASDSLVDDPNVETKSLADFLIDIAEQNEQFTEEDIVDELCTLMLAGQDSVGAAIAFCLHFLGKHQDIQDRVIEELDAIFEDSVRTPTLQDLKEMRYLEQCLKETLRIYPSVPIIARRINEDLPMGEYTLPAGSEVLISPYVLHHLPHIYPDPKRFDPDRFSPENVAKRHPNSFIPFSAGPRNCIGYKFALMEMKTVVSALLRNYRMKLAPGKPEFVLMYRMTLRAKGGIWLSFTPRHKHGAQETNSSTSSEKN